MQIITQPVARNADPGRDLEIVMALAQALDVQPETPGKRITARISLLDTGGA
ncbi:hypothetical protein [Streptomyces incanus]